MRAPVRAPRQGAPAVAISSPPREELVAGSSPHNFSDTPLQHNPWRSLLWEARQVPTGVSKARGHWYHHGLRRIDMVAERVVVVGRLPPARKEHGRQPGRAQG